MAATMAGVFGCAHPATAVATGCGVAVATTGLGVALWAPPDLTAGPGPGREGGAELCVRGAAVGLGGGGGVGAFLTAMVAGRCWIETTSA